MATFRRRYWEEIEIDALGSFHPRSYVELLQLCFSFAVDMKTSIFLPAAARYWSKLHIDRDHGAFAKAICALTSFIVLRRAATGTTAGIDSDFRDLMNRENSSPFCAGLTKQHVVPELEVLKDRLRGYLRKSPVGVHDKNSWTKSACVNPLANQSTSLTRFLLLAAADGSLPDEEFPGLWRRDDVVPSDERSYLSFQCWRDDRYKTIEHVAPQSESGSHWDTNIYRDAYTRHTLGNLVLLPQAENSAAGNSGWEKKKLFFLALTEKERSKQDQRVREAEYSGFTFSRKFQSLLKKGSRLHMLDPVRGVEAWDGELIQARSENIASLAWDRIAPWLYD